MNLDKLLRKNIRDLKPYSSARDEFTGEAMVFLDANENPFNSPYNRYPDPLQRKLKEKIGQLKHVPADSIFLGNGSDEPIDLLLRAFCEPGQHYILVTDPTYGMYEVAAGINNIEVLKVSLDKNFQLDAELFLSMVNENTRLAFLCSPNNPTGNSLDINSILKIVNEFNGLVILDEAYIDFALEKSFLSELEKHSNLVVLQTFSKAWGMAGIRLGMAFASPEIIRVLNKIKYPYNINILTQQKALELLDNTPQMKEWVKEILSERESFSEEIKKFPFTLKVFPSDANFILIKMHDAKGIYFYLTEKGIIVRDRSKVSLCEGCLMITIGKKEENQLLIDALNELI